MSKLDEQENQKEKQKEEKELIETLETKLPDSSSLSPFKDNTPRAITHPSKEDTYLQVKQAAGALAQMREVAETIVKSGMCPLESAEDVILAITTGNQYGLPFMTSVNFIHPIKGKPSMSTHLHRALILRNRIMFRKTLDYEPIYAFCKVDKEGRLIKSSKGKTIIISKGTMAEKPEEKVFANKIDYITEYIFERHIQLPNGKWDILKVKSSFTISEARDAELLDKDNWKKHPPRMLDARAFSIGAKEIAADILLGIPTINEMADIEDIEYTIDADLTETVG